MFLYGGLILIFFELLKKKLNILNVKCYKGGGKTMDARSIRLANLKSLGWPMFNSGRLPADMIMTKTCWWKMEKIQYKKRIFKEIDVMT